MRGPVLKREGCFKIIKRIMECRGPRLLWRVHAGTSIFAAGSLFGLPRCSRLAAVRLLLVASAFALCRAAQFPHARLNFVNQA